MVITNVEASLLEFPFKNKIGSMPKFKVTATLLRIKDDDLGVEGIAASHFVNADEGMVAFFKRWKKLLLKQDPLEIEALTSRFNDYTMRILIGIPQAVSLVNCALWDLIGKYMNQPVCKLIGLYQKRIKTYASMAYWMKPAEQVKMANTAIEKGFKAIKIRLGQGLEKDEEILKTLRDSFPTPKELEIMADVNSGYPFQDTIKIARMCEKFELEWLEEPVFSDDVDGLARLRSAVDIPIAGGENNYGIFEFKHLLEKKCYDIIQPDATRSGGISIVKKIGALAESFGIDCTPHVFGTGLVQAANLQVIATLPNARYFEYGFYPTFFLLMKEGDLEVQDGEVIVPMGPGLGREFDEEGAKQFLK
ncbi:MAG: mandelate racemase/muconate lactonizing enzyme family protein [Candidatus Helarchaeota archaeon]